jgi:DNA-binding XRE family transcriptional regulator
MMIGAKDRSYYRVESNHTLIDEAKYNPNIELCIVLAERLKQAEWDIKEANHQRDYHFD